jgi:hypothetical protein
VSWDRSRVFKGVITHVEVFAGLVLLCYEKQHCSEIRNGAV